MTANRSWTNREEMTGTVNKDRASRGCVRAEGQTRELPRDETLRDTGEPAGDRGGKQPCRGPWRAGVRARTEACGVACGVDPRLRTEVTREPEGALQGQPAPRRGSRSPEHASSGNSIQRTGALPQAVLTSAKPDRLAALNFLPAATPPPSVCRRFTRFQRLRWPDALHRRRLRTAGRGSGVIRAMPGTRSGKIKDCNHCRAQPGSATAGVTIWAVRRRHCALSCSPVLPAGLAHAGRCIRRSMPTRRDHGERGSSMQPAAIVRWSSGRSGTCPPSARLCRRPPARRQEPH